MAFNPLDDPVFFFFVVEGLNICTNGSATSCEDCLLIHPKCAWCSKEVGTLPCSAFPVTHYNLLNARKRQVLSSSSFSCPFPTPALHSERLIQGGGALPSLADFMVTHV